MILCEPSLTTQIVHSVRSVSEQISDWVGLRRVGEGGGETDGVREGNSVELFCLLPTDEIYTNLGL